MMEEIIKTDNGALTALLAEFKNHLRLTSDDSDADLRSKLVSALTSVGHDIHRVLASSAVIATAVADSVGGKISLTLRGPVREVTMVSVDGEELQEGDGYTVKGNRLQIYGSYREATVEVRYTAGYHFEDLPSDLWEAVCLRGAGAYSNPLDGVQERLRASDVLIRPYRYTDWRS